MLAQDSSVGFTSLIEHELEVNTVTATYTDSQLPEAPTHCSMVHLPLLVLRTLTACCATQVVLAE